MKVGDYVRDSEGEIAKIIKKHEFITEDNIYIGTTYYWKSLKDNCEGCFSEDMHGIKSNPNIIDLIEIGDYVNGHRVNYINKDREHFNISFGNEDFNLKSKFNSDIYWLSKEDIKSIVTKEQFSQMEYRIRE